MFQWKRVPITRGLISRMFAYGLIIVVLCTGLAYAASATGPAEYGARSEIIYPIAFGQASGGFLRDDQHLATQLVTLKSRQILTPVAAKYHLTVDQLGAKVTAAVLDNSEVIRVQVNDHSPAVAEALVGAIVGGYLKHLPDASLIQQTTLHTQIDAANGVVQSLNDRLAGISNATSAGAVALQSELQSALNNRDSLQTQLDAAVVQAAATAKVDWLTQPYLLNGKVSPKPIQAGIAGFLLGLMLAAGVIVLMIRRMLKKLPSDPNV
jgi:uncharacterized protein involved in exopolysaccharide biosynthesis